jgi:hypothetical protein
MVSGVWKFPYPLPETWIQLILTHMLLIFFSALTRSMASPLRRMGLAGMIAPSVPVTTSGNYRNPVAKTGNPAIAFLRWLSNGTGGIAGGGLFEFNTRTAKQVLPLSLVFSAKLALGNMSFAFTVWQSFFTLSRIMIIPFTLILTHFMCGAIHSATVVSACLAATLNLLAASVSTGIRITWETPVAGFLSTIFVALYPILLLRTMKTLQNNLTPQGGAAYSASTSGLFNDPHGGYDVSNGAHSTSDSPHSVDQTRAYYQLLHYTSMLTIILLTPLVLLSGDVGEILHNCPHFDVKFLWFLMVCGGIGSTAVFAATPLFVHVTSPLTLVMVGATKAALLLVFLEGKGLGVANKVGVALCIMSTVWYAVVRRREIKSRLGR